MAPAGTTVSQIYSKEQLCLMEPQAPSCGIVIFGASGDLTHRKLLPSLLTLANDKLLPKSYYVLGVARTPLSDDAFRNSIRKTEHPLLKTAAGGDFLSRCGYLHGDYTDPALYKTLKARLEEMDKRFQIPGRWLFYLSTPPSLYATIADRLGAGGLSRSSYQEGWVRLVVEKPFGRDVESAKSLNQALHQVFREEQIYRIDHYLGKETVQNILMFRFANAIYEPLWNQHYIQQVQITAAEAVGVEHRAGYYEQAGVLRDMFQNHLFQLLSLVAMEPPTSLDPEAMRNEKSKVIASLIRPSGSTWDDISVRGQYTAGSVSGKAVPAYREEEGVNPHSTTETYAALEVELDNWRWQGVPFYLRSGKVMPRRETEIKIQFKHVPASIFKPLMADQLAANELTFRIQPDEGIGLSFEAKHPGPKLCMSTVTMQFNYQDAFKTAPPEAYTRLFLDVMLGDQTLFAREDWVTCSWDFLTPLLDHWVEKKEKGLYFYPAGSWGPAEGDLLLDKKGYRWLTP